MKLMNRGVQDVMGTASNPVWSKSVLVFELVGSFLSVCHVELVDAWDPVSRYRRIGLHQAATQSILDYFPNLVYYHK